MSEDFDKYLGIANHDIQMANNMGELKSYVASILYDNDKKAELLQQRDNIIKEVREIFKYYGVKEDIVGYSTYIITGEDLLKLLEILDKAGETDDSKRDV